MEVILIFSDAALCFQLSVVVFLCFLGFFFAFVLESPGLR